MANAFSKLITQNDVQNILAHINLGDDAHREVTQAEFDLLTEEQKNDGTIYFISDGVSTNIFLDDNTPVGMIAPYGGTTDPAYWLICDGRAVSREAYAELYAVIGTTYGVGDGSTTFNIPNLQGRVPMGMSTNYALGASGGEAVHTLTAAELAAHGHDVKSWVEAGTLGNAKHWTDNGTTLVDVTAGRSFASTTGSWYNTTFQVAQSGTGDGTGMTLQAGGNQAHNNLQPYTVTNYIIKASSALSETQSQLDFFYPVGSFYETSNVNFNPNLVWGGTWEPIGGKASVYNYGSATVASATAYTLCSISLAANTRYIVHASTSSNEGAQHLMGCFLGASPSPTTWLYNTGRAVTSSGGGPTNWAYIQTSDATTTVTLTCYGYYTTSHVEYGKMIAIPIQDDGNIKWHRTA